MVAACGTPGDGDGRGTMGVIVTVPFPFTGTLQLRWLASFGTSFVLEDVAVTR